jgi:hypothetical protein
MLIPRFHEKPQLFIYLVQEKIVQEPDMVGVVDVEPMSDLKQGERVCPSRPDLARDVAP